MQMDIRGIVFDKDGTLLDFYETWIPAYQDAARRVCEYANQSGRELEMLVSTGFEDSTSRLVTGSPLACESNERIAHLWSDVLGLGDAVSVLEILESAFDVEGAARAVPVPELVPLLSRLHDRGLVLGMATMDSETQAHTTLNLFEVAHLFSFVCGYDSGYGQKPEPGMVHGFCERTSLTPDQCIVIGDTPHDLQMGISAGAAMTVGVLTGASDHQTLSDLADHVVPDIRSLEHILGS